MSEGNEDPVKDSADWYDLFQQLIHHAFSTSSLRGESPKDHPMILAERSYNSPHIRQQLMECLFEELQVPAAFLAKDAVLSCYASGRTSATVVDFGYAGTTVTPVYDGYVEAKGIRRNPSASLHRADTMVLETLDTLYRKKKKASASTTIAPLYQVLGCSRRKDTIHHAARLHMANECRLHGAGVSINTAPKSSDSNTQFHAPSVPFELPDGTTIDVPSVERFRVSEALFGSSTSDADETYLAEVKTTISGYIQSATSGSSDSNSTSDDANETKQLHHESVGSSVLSSSSSSNNNNNRKTPKRSAAAWRRACTPHLQHLHDTLLTAAPVPTMICDAAYRCERDQQGVLLGNVIVSGGGACIGPTEQAVPDTIKEGVETLIHQHTPGWRVKVLTPSVTERAVLPWIGGSIVGSLGTFHDIWISKAEYEEWGSAIVNRKCP